MHLCIVQVMFTAFLSSNVDLHLGGPGRTPPSRALLDRVLGGQTRRNTHLVIDLIFKMEGTGQIDCCFVSFCLIDSFFLSYHCHLIYIYIYMRVSRFLSPYVSSFDFTCFPLHFISHCFFVYLNIIALHFISLFHFVMLRCFTPVHIISRHFISHHFP